ncbi:MFS transporter [Gordonia otitidis]|uniref:Major facilitator superfamily protein n=1 Tax=Gordonia otitidis (strain DSM 44809 / CCUG 52243 / JCM 12355 / NBRC 100426 / IFM 10032) TaxID=1108044 RepID=H5TU81_GORO1|nr:MFS transporter [Gordonia otitidis]GAB37039.1 putative major facilitator superfamily protein [Gordonia otitidis NBRC 100426]
MASAWQPLKSSVFRNLFIAQLVSNIGLWMQSVGAQWYLVDQHAGPAVISLVQTASLAPTLLLSLVAGVLADSLDRKWLLVVMSVYSTAIGVLMAVLAFTGHLNPATLLILTFLLGAGAALSSPAFQAIQPELVPRDEIPDAASLGSVSVNAARAIGPALAGVIFSLGGAGTVFLLNAISYLAVVVALLMWKRSGQSSDIVPERLSDSLWVGLRYVAAAPIVRRILLRSALFAIPASALWALLPLIVAHSFHLGSSGYGLVLGVLGVGAMIGVALMPWMRQHLSSAAILALSALVFAIATIGAAFLPLWPCLVLFLFAGIAWIATLTTLNAGAQLTLPQWVRARGMAAYLLVFMGSQGIGALIWGALGSAIGTRWALVIAGVCLLLTAASVRLLPPSPVTGKLSRDLSMAWPVPTLIFEPDPDDGPVEVSAIYNVPANRHADFLAAMPAVARSRRRTGARNWHLYRSADEPDHYVEQFIVPSWSEYQRQHRERWTEYDHDNVARVLAMTETGIPDERHLFSTDLR